MGYEIRLSGTRINGEPVTALTANRPEWMDGRQLCAQTDPAIFHPGKGQSHIARRAKQVCADCELREPCLLWALETNDQWGILGGLTASERRRLRKGAA